LKEAGEILNELGEKWGMGGFGRVWAVQNDDVTFHTGKPPTFQSFGLPKFNLVWNKLDQAVDLYPLVESNNSWNKQEPSTLTQDQKKIMQNSAESSSENGFIRPGTRSLSLRTKVCHAKLQVLILDPVNLVWIGQINPW
jgi:hypothetical protein